MPRALILGVGGQDGAYLARLLVARGLGVAGTTRGGSVPWRLAELQVGSEVALHSDDDIAATVAATAPQEIYDLRGPAPGEAIDAEALLARTRDLLGAAGGARVLIAGAGGDTAFDPAFSTAKAAVAELVAAARATGAFAVTARLSEHASRLARGGTAARLISQVQAAARGAALSLDAPDTVHDLGWAPEYVDALRAMAQAARPADHAVATGLTITERDFAAHAAEWFGVAVDFAAAPPVAIRGDAPPPGWRAFTHGRDLVRTLCEGAAAA